MYWANAYDALLKPAFVFVTALFAAIAAAQFRPAKKYWKYSRLIVWLMAAAAAVWTVLAVTAFAGLTRYYAGASPAALNGAEWTGWTNRLFAMFSKNYGNTAYLIWYLSAGFLQGCCLAQILPDK